MAEDYVKAYFSKFASVVAVGRAMRKVEVCVKGSKVGVAEWAYQTCLLFLCF